jgi:hypothetical protein
MEIDLHGYHPDDLGCRWGAEDGGLFQKLIQQSWEMGTSELRFIHGYHSHGRGAPTFVNTNTGFLGLSVRRCLRNDKTLRHWIKPSTLDCRDPGVTSIQLKTNSAPTRNEIDCL